MRCPDCEDPMDIVITGNSDFTRTHYVCMYCKIEYVFKNQEIPLLRKFLITDLRKEEDTKTTTEDKKPTKEEQEKSMWDNYGKFDEVKE